MWGLRSARCSRGLTEHTVAEMTKLSPRVIAAIEEGRFDRLPGGIYARASIRTYARAVGLEDPALLEAILEAVPVVDVELQTIVNCRETPVDRGRSYRTAAAVDAAIVTGISAGEVLVCAALTGPGAWSALAVCIALLAIGVPTLLLYFGLLGATGVGTAGARLLDIDFVPRLNGPVDGTELLQRIRGYMRSEALALLTGKIACSTPIRTCQ